MKFILVFFGIAVMIACSSSTKSIMIDNSIRVDTISANETAEMKCPKNHIDSIIPIIYGFPSEESFQKSDSGFVYLGGCELPENAPNWYCKIHDLTF